MKSKMKKKILAMLCILVMIFSLAACGNKAGDTVYGKVTAIDGSTVTVQLGEMSQEAGSQQGQPPGDGSDSQQGEAPSDQQGADSDGSGDTVQQTATNSDSGSNQQPPEKPDGDSSGSAPSGNAPSGQPPEKPEAGSNQQPPTNSGNSQSAGSTDSTNNQQPPEKPEGDSSSSDSNSQAQSGEAPSGEAPSGEAPTDGVPNGEAPSGEAQAGMPGGGGFTAGDESASYDLSNATITKDGNESEVGDISEGDILKITLDKSGNAAEVEIVSAGGFGGSGNVEQGSSANTIDEDGTYSDETYTSTGDDENALRVDGAEVTLTGITVSKDGGSSSNTEDGDFYGMNAALLATDGATVTIKNATVTSDAQNGNGIFCYGSGTTVNVSDTTITTTKDNSGGIQTTGGATTNASNLTVSTAGNSSAAIRSDRGGGTVNVDGGTYTSSGYNSPAVYSTADITVKNAKLTAKNSEALVIEGQNSITLENCTVTGNMSDTKGTSSDENVHNVMIYQSMSGDAEVGTSEFSMTGGSLTSKNGDMLYITNTNCTIELTDVTIKNADSDGYLMNICGNSASHGWGTAGANGGNVTFTASDQTLKGDIVVDTISTLNMKLTDSSTFTGTVNIVDNAEGGTAVSDNAVITIDSGCTWNLTGNCTVTSLTNNGTINFNGHTITLADGTVLK